MKKFQTLVALLAHFAAIPSMASTEIATWPWQLLSGGYDSAVNDGRILAYPDDLISDGRFFRLVENSIMTMTADNGGFSRSTAPIVEQCIPQLCVPNPFTGTQICSFGPSDPACIAQMPWQPGDNWENSNGGRGFTSSFCGGYSAADGCTQAPPVEIVLGGPPTAMDDGASALSPKDLAAGGWPAKLLEFVKDHMLALPICVAPAGLDDLSAHACAPGMTYRVTNTNMFASPDAGRQWYPFASSCSLSDHVGADAIGVDPGNPAHLVVAKVGRGDPQYGDASGCHAPSACAERSIAWTRDVSEQIAAAILATMPGATDTTHAVDRGGGPDPDDPAIGWRYAALGHLALSTGKGTCDVFHAGIQLGCDAKLQTMCHGQKPTGGSHEAFCPDYGQDACRCRFTGENGGSKTIAEANCEFPEVGSLSIDPRNGQVYAPSSTSPGWRSTVLDGAAPIQTGLLFSPDGGRKWRRHGHGPFVRWTSLGPTLADTAEPWLYLDDPDPADDNLHTPPNSDNDPGVRVLTMQGLPIVPGTVDSASVGDALALDLNAQPELLDYISRVSIVATPCAGPPVAGETANYVVPAAFSTDPPGFARNRVRVTATLAASWHNPLAPGHLLSAVFVARGDSCTNAAAKEPLVFRDTANLMPAGFDEPLGLIQYAAPLGVLDGDTHWSPDIEQKWIDGKKVVKLPQSQVRGTDCRGCAMHYVAAAVSPSDPRILHAWGYGGDGSGYCAAQTGLWRSVDGGATWHLAVGALDPQTHAGFVYAARVVLTVSPTNPYRVMVAHKASNGVSRLNFAPTSSASAASDRPNRRFPAVFPCPRVPSSPKTTRFCLLQTDLATRGQLSPVHTSARDRA